MLPASYCKTLYFHCVFISRFSYVENLLHFNLVLFPGADADKLVVMWADFRNSYVLFNFVILVKLRKFDACEIYVFYSMLSLTLSTMLHVRPLLLTSVTFDMATC